MVARKPRIAIVGAGMAGLTAAHRLHTSTTIDTFDLSVVEASDRIGGRIRTSEFAGVRIEMGATWIHGVGGSPIYTVAKQIGALESSTPWERMDGFPTDPVTVAEGGFLVDSNFESSISSLHTDSMDFAKTPAAAEEGGGVGGFLRRRLEESRGGSRRVTEVDLPEGWSLEELEDAVFKIHEEIERTNTSADDLDELDLAAESEYRSFPDEEITIAKGYSRVIEYFASALPVETIQLGKKVERIEWCLDETTSSPPSDFPVKLYFKDGSVMTADHVIITVSLGVLKAGKVLFSPQLPEFKRNAIGRLGFGLVDKLFLELDGFDLKFPFLQLAFDQNVSRQASDIPRWFRRTSSICPVHGGSNVLLNWVVGKNAAEMEELKDDEIVSGIHATLEKFSPPRIGDDSGGYGRIRKVARSMWGSDPLFLGSYSYVAVGSSGKDLDLMAEPLPRGNSHQPRLLFAGEATHRTHYSTTHGAYFSGIREANRLLHYYKQLSCKKNIYY